MKIKLRKAVDSDKNFIFSSWLQSYYMRNKNIDYQIFFGYEQKKLEDIIPRSETYVVADPNDLNQIIGYVTYEIIEGVVCIHFMYIKKIFRNKKIAKQVLRSILLLHGKKLGDSFCYTHETFASIAIAKRYGGFYHPYLQYKQEPTQGDNDVQQEEGSTREEARNDTGDETSGN